MTEIFVDGYNIEDTFEHNGVKICRAYKEKFDKMTPEEQDRYAEHYSFGTPCAGSRWFSGKPNFSDERMIPVMRRWMCPIKGCGGEMKSAGWTWPTGNPGYHHTCNNKECGFTAAIRGGSYPKIKYMTEEEYEDSHH